MKQNLFKNIFFILALLLILLLVFTFEKIRDSILFFSELILSLNLSQLSLNEIDQLIGIICLILFELMAILYLFVYLKILRVKFVEVFISKLNNASKEFCCGFVMLVIILIISLTAPIISPDNPNFHKDISITKLLPPFSKLNYVYLKSADENKNRLEILHKKLFENFNEEKREYFLGIEIKDSLIILYKDRDVKLISINEIETSDNQPIVKTKIFYLGTDEFGRDLLSRIIYSIRLSVLISLLSVLISFLIGSSIGYVAGISGGLIDNLLMRIVDFFLSFPILFFVIFLIAFVGNSILLLIIVFGFSGWMYVARLARNETLACIQKEFIQTLFLMGQSKVKIIIKHILPNTFSPILITLIFLMSNVIIAESALSFIGLGIQPPTPTLGGIIKSGYDYLSISWWIAFFGSLTLVAIILAFNLFAEGIRKLKRT